MVFRSQTKPWWRQRRRRHGKRESFRTTLWTTAFNCNCPIYLVWWPFLVCYRTSFGKRWGSINDKLLLAVSPKSSMNREIGENPVADWPFPEKSANVLHFIDQLNDDTISPKYWSLAYSDWLLVWSWVHVCRFDNWLLLLTSLEMDVQSKIEKVPRGIRGEKSSKDMASSRNKE